MKKLWLVSIVVLFSVVTANAQIGKNFTAEMKALLDASIEKIKGEKAVNEKTIGESYLSTLPLTGFKVLLREIFDTYHVSCFYNGEGSQAMMDTIARKLSKLLYVVVDSKQQPKILEEYDAFDPARKILLVDIAGNRKSKIILAGLRYSDILITIYKNW